MRALVAAILLVFLAGCETTAARPPLGADLTPEEATALSTRQFADYLRDKTVYRLIDLCGWDAPDRADCFRRNLIEGFDETGEAKHHCLEGKTDLEQVQCFLVGWFGYSIARSAHLEAAGNFDWSDPGAELEVVMKQLATHTVDRCEKSGLGFGRACLGELASLLSLSSGQAETCEAVPTVAEGIDCVVHTHLLQTVKAALNRMGTTGI